MSSSISTRGRCEINRDALCSFCAPSKTLWLLLIGDGASVRAQSRVQVCVHDFISWLKRPNLTTSLDTFASY